MKLNVLLLVHAVSHGDDVAAAAVPGAELVPGLAEQGAERLPARLGPDTLHEVFVGPAVAAASPRLNRNRYDSRQNQYS